MVGLRLRGELVNFIADKLKSIQQFDNDHDSFYFKASPCDTRTMVYLYKEQLTYQSTWYKSAIIISWKRNCYRFGIAEELYVKLRSLTRVLSVRVNALVVDL